MRKNKKFLLTLLAGFVFVVSLPLMAAYEAHVINVTAHIENALKVTPDKLVFGTVFPQEYHEKRIWVTTSKSFCDSDQTRVLNIDYKIVQKPKCINEAGGYASVDYATHECPCGYNEMPLLCPYLSKTPVYDDPEPYKDYGVLAFHNPSDLTSIATGTINKYNDLADEWIIDLPVPCFEGYCAQDWPTFVESHNPGADPELYELIGDPNGTDLGCDLWIEVTRIY